jgi:hypothetical protein
MSSIFRSSFSRVQSIGRNFSTLSRESRLNKEIDNGKRMLRREMSRTIKIGAKDYGLDRWRSELVNNGQIAKRSIKKLRRERQSAKTRDECITLWPFCP